MCVFIDDENLIKFKISEMWLLSLYDGHISSNKSYFRGKHGHIFNVKLPTGNWRILGTANELTEEQWKEVVEPSERSGMFKSYKEHFTNPYFFAYDTANESGASLLKLHKLENPLILIKE